MQGWTARRLTRDSVELREGMKQGPVALERGSAEMDGIG